MAQDQNSRNQQILRVIIDQYKEKIQRPGSAPPTSYTFNHLSDYSDHLHSNFMDIRQDPQYQEFYKQKGSPNELPPPVHKKTDLEEFSRKIKACNPQRQRLSTIGSVDIDEQMSSSNIRKTSFTLQKMTENMNQIIGDDHFDDEYKDQQDYTKNNNNNNNNNSNNNRNENSQFVTDGTNNYIQFNISSVTSPVQHQSSSNFTNQIQNQSNNKFQSPYSPTSAQFMPNQFGVINNLITSSSILNSTPTTSSSTIPNNSPMFVKAASYSEQKDSKVMQALQSQFNGFHISSSSSQTADQDLGANNNNINTNNIRMGEQMNRLYQNTSHRESQFQESNSLPQQPYQQFRADNNQVLRNVLRGEGGSKAQTIGNLHFNLNIDHSKLQQLQQSHNEQQLQQYQQEFNFYQTLDQQQLLHSQNNYHTSNQFNQVPNNNNTNNNFYSQNQPQQQVTHQNYISYNPIQNHMLESAVKAAPFHQQQNLQNKMLTASKFAANFTPISNNIQRLMQSPNNKTSNEFMRKPQKSDSSPAVTHSTSRNVYSTDLTDLQLQNLLLDPIKVALDQSGCRMLQEKLNTKDQRIINQILEAVMPIISQLYMAQFGNYLCQKIFERCNQQNLDICISYVKGKQFIICSDSHGTRTMQKLVEVTAKYPALLNQMRQQIIRPNLVRLVQDINGNHVVQKCLQCYSKTDSQFVYDEFIKGCVQIATHKHGCCVLQKCITNADPTNKAKLIDKVIECTKFFVKDPFANYVVQFMLQKKDFELNRRIALQLKGDYEKLAIQKFSSNVIQKCLEYNSVETQNEIVLQILKANSYLEILKSNYGNYVIQKTLNAASPEYFDQLVEKLRPQMAILKRSNQFGQKIYSKLARSYPQLAINDYDSPPRNYHRNQVTNKQGSGKKKNYKKSNTYYQSGSNSSNSSYYYGNKTSPHYNKSHNYYKPIAPPPSMQYQMRSQHQQYNQSYDYQYQYYPKQQQQQQQQQFSYNPEPKIQSGTSHYQQQQQPQQQPNNVNINIHIQTGDGPRQMQQPPAQYINSGYNDNYGYNKGYNYQGNVGMNSSSSSNSNFYSPQLQQQKKYLIPSQQFYPVSHGNNMNQQSYQNDKSWQLKEQYMQQQSQQKQQQQQQLANQQSGQKFNIASQN